MTFSNVIVSHERFSNGLLFHEFVHAEQYRQLAIPRFADLYVRGFLTGGGGGILLEINAYALGARFESAPNVPFSVESEVSSWIKHGKFYAFAPQAGLRIRGKALGCPHAVFAYGTFDVSSAISIPNETNDFRPLATVSNTLQISHL